MKGEMVNVRHLRSARSLPRGLSLIFAASVLAGMLFVASTGQAAAACPNEAIREAQKSTTLPEGSTFLPDCMALEMVSPPKKFNQGAAIPGFSADGERVRFFSLAALGEAPSLAQLANPYVASRGPSGWSTQSVAPPAEINSGFNTAAVPCAYTPDLSRWVTYGSTHAQAQLGILTPFGGTLGGTLSPIGPTVAPLSGGLEASVGFEGTINGSRCWGAPADASRIFFKVFDAAYLPGDPQPTSNGVSVFSFGNVYEAFLDEGTPTLRLLQRDREGAVYGGTCGAQVGNGDAVRGAISADGSLVIFSARPTQPEGVKCDQAANEVRIMQRTETPTGPVISELFSSECTRISPPCSSKDGDDRFLGASQEADKVLFTTSRQLADSDEDETEDLYLHDASKPAGERLTQISAGDGSGPTPGKDAEFLGVPDFAGDGSRVYFVAKDVLTITANPGGDSAEAGKPNLYLYQRDAAHPDGSTAFVATLSPEDEPTWESIPGENNLARAVPRLGPDVEDQSVGGDGHVLVLASKAALLADDTDGGQLDLYRYDAESGDLQRISAAAPGGADNGAFEAVFLAGSVNAAAAENVYFNRSISEDGTTIAFVTAEGLDPADTDGEPNAYLWREGALIAIPIAARLTVSMSGDQVAFASREQLLPEDGDASEDVYVARAGGGFPIPIPPPPCTGEACQGPPSPRPGDQGVASEVVRPGNPAASKPCRRGYVKKRGRCIKPARHRTEQRKNRHKKPAGRKQGGKK
jgi:hypothetical protein